MIESECLVVRSYDFRETSLIVDLISRELGSVRALGKGALNPEKNWTASFLPLSHIKVSLYPGKNIYLVGNCEMISFFPIIRENLYRLCLATSLVEIAYLISPPPHEELFSFLFKALHFLNKEDSPLSLFSVYSWLKILRFSGFHPELKKCVVCGKSKELSFYSVELGGVLCGKCRMRDSCAISVDKQLLGIFPVLSRISLSETKRINIFRSHKKKLKEIIYRHLLYRLESKPPALRFLEKIFLRDE